ncbi:MAG: hypothetical protein VX112_03990 [Pseudomonadota bacterium]|nr:hypothetical protein [Pseudomonadota bacterium]
MNVQPLSLLARSVLSPWLLVFFGLCLCLAFFFYFRKQKSSSREKIQPYISKNHDVEIAQNLNTIPLEPEQTQPNVTQQVQLSSSPLTSRVDRSHDHFSCCYTRLPMNDPIVLANGNIINRDQVLLLLSNHSDSNGMRKLLVGGVEREWYCADLSQSAMRSHRNAIALQSWMQSQPSFQQSLIWENPHFAFITIDFSLVKQNISLLSCASTPQGFLEDWYDENYLYKDPVINSAGETVELPDEYRSLLDFSHYHQIEVVKVTYDTSQNRIYWVKTPQDGHIRDAKTIFDLSKTPNLTLDSLFMQFYPDTFTVNIINAVKPFLEQYAQQEKLPKQRQDFTAGVG